MKQVELTAFDGGSCTHFETVVMKKGRWKTVSFPSLFFLLRHPEEGCILYDTGYSFHFMNETKKLPFSLYRKLIPVDLKEEDLAVTKLAKLGLNPDEVKWVICSHFHSDHVSGLKDFTQARFIYLEDSLRDLMKLGPWRQTLEGFVPSLLPQDFGRRAYPLTLNKLRPLPQEIFPFTQGLDLLGDQSLWGVPLPGHVKGQLGLYFKGQNKSYFLIADACWMSHAYRSCLPPRWPAKLLMDCFSSYEKTLQQLSELSKRNKEIEIIPSHCGEKYHRLVKGKRPLVKEVNGWDEKTQKPFLFS